MSRIHTLTVSAVLSVALGAAPAPARADATLFAGIAPPTPRPVVGAAWGRFSRVVGYELELAVTPGPSHQDSFGSFGVNLLARTPLRIRGAQIYGTAGFGISNARGEDLTRSIGAGTKLQLGGPLGLRIDYRLFLFPHASGGEPTERYRHRLYAGLTVPF